MSSMYRTHINLTFVLALAGACELSEQVVGETADGFENAAADGTVPEAQANELPSSRRDAPNVGIPERSDDPGVELPSPIDDSSELPNTPQILADFAGALVADDAFLYVEAGDQTIQRVSKATGEAQPVAQLLPGSSTEVLAVDDTTLFYTEGGSTVFRTPKTGGVVQRIAQTPGPNNSPPYAIAVDDDWVYLSFVDVWNTSLRIGEIRRVAKDGTIEEVIAEDYSRELVTGESSLYWARTRGNGGSELMRLDTQSDEIAPLVQERGEITSIATFGTRLYWVVEDAGQQFVRTQLADGTIDTIFVADANGRNRIDGAIAGQEGLFWLRAGGGQQGAVLRLDLSGEFTELVAAPASFSVQRFEGPFGARLAVDDSAVYWSYEGRQGGVPRLFQLLAE